MSYCVLFFVSVFCFLHKTKILKKVRQEEKKKQTKTKQNKQKKKTKEKLKLRPSWRDGKYLKDDFPYLPVIKFSNIWWNE